MKSQHLTTNLVEDALKAVSPDSKYGIEIIQILSSAWVQAREDEDYWEAEGKPHLRTFLKTTPLGLAIVDLARAILDNSEENS